MIASKCRSCKAAIIWAVTENDKPMPIDFEPVPDGNVVLEEVAGQDAPLAHVLGSGALDLYSGALRRMPHFATCKDAASWRR